MIERIGIVGGGQLGRMLTQDAKPLGFEVTVVDPVENCPATQVGADQIQGGLKDAEAIRELVESCDVTTWEIEHIDTNTLQSLESNGHNIQPSPAILGIIQDKLDQKDLLRNNSLPVADYRYIWGDFTIREAVRALGNNLIIKSRKGGYDGRGNEIYRGQSVRELNKNLGPELYAEKIIDFERELAVLAARDTQGNVAVYPTVETVHKDNICHAVSMPAEISSKVARATEEIARETLKHLGGAGLFAIEMFQTDEEVVVNEIAPRVHNSGHLTIEACETSQFEQHIRAVTGMPLGRTRMRAPAAVMINILGNRNERLARRGLNKVLAMPDTHPHFYGKDPRPARKVGHITVLGTSIKEALERAQQAREALEI
jgi:5-(carboxyamino)imidazole ribonucleotide synthase